MCDVFCQVCCSLLVYLTFSNVVCFINNDWLACLSRLCVYIINFPAFVYRVQVAMKHIEKDKVTHWVEVNQLMHIELLLYKISQFGSTVCACVTQCNMLEQRIHLLIIVWCCALLQFLLSCGNWVSVLFAFCVKMTKATVCGECFLKT